MNKLSNNSDDKDTKDMSEIIIDSYPLRRWLVLGSTQLPSYKVLREYLVDKYKVCYFCDTAVKTYPQVDGENFADDNATIDHLNPRQYRKRFELSLKVLACFRCNQERNNAIQRNTQKVTLADIASPTPSKEASKVLNKALKEAYKKMSNITSTELEDIFTRHIQMLRTSRPDLERAIEAYVAQRVLEGRIDEVEKLRQDQLKFVKAQSGHIRNNNNWPRTRGAGKTALDAVAWLDKRLIVLNKQLTNNMEVGDE